MKYWTSNWPIRFLAYFTLQYLTIPTIPTLPYSCNKYCDPIGDSEARDNWPIRFLTYFTLQYPSPVQLPRLLKALCVSKDDVFCTYLQPQSSMKHTALIKHSVTEKLTEKINDYYFIISYNNYYAAKSQVWYHWYLPLSDSLWIPRWLVQLNSWQHLIVLIQQWLPAHWSQSHSI